MLNNTNLKQRKEIPMLPAERKEYEEMIKLHAENKIEKKEIKAKVNTSVHVCFADRKKTLQVDSPPPDL